MVYIDKDKLKELLDHGIITDEEFSRYTRDLEMTKKTKYLKMHNYKITKGKNGRWFTHLPDKTSKSGRKLVSKMTKEEVEAVVIHYYEHESDYSTVKEVFDEWCKLQLERKCVEMSTINRYRVTYNQCMKDFGYKLVEKISEDDIEEFIYKTIRRCQLTRKDYANLKTVLYGVFNLARKKKMIDFYIEPFVKNLDIPKKLFRKIYKEDEKLVFSKDEMKLIIGFLTDSKDHILDMGLLLLFYTGMRPGELSALKWEDVGENYIYVHRTEQDIADDGWHHTFVVKDSPKTEAGVRNVYIPENYLWIIDAIRRLNPDGKYMFEENGKRKISNSFSNRLTRVCNYLNIPVKSLNKIRKTYATILIDNGVPESIIQKQLGHVDIATTKQYYYKNMHSEQMRYDAVSQVFA